MSEEPSNAPGFSKTILKEVFGEIGFEEAVSLVGILYEYRIVFSKAVSVICQNPATVFSLKPLMSQTAAILVGDLFGMDCDKLCLAFTRDWRKLKDSPRVKELIASIKGHEYVDRLERFSLL